MLWVNLTESAINVDSHIGIVRAPPWAQDQQQEVAEEPLEAWRTRINRWKAFSSSAFLCRHGSDGHWSAGSLGSQWTVTTWAHEVWTCGHAVTEASWTNQLVCVCHHLSVSGAPTGWRRGSPPVWKPPALLRCRGWRLCALSAFLSRYLDILMSAAHTCKIATFSLCFLIKLMD